MEVDNATRQAEWARETLLAIKQNELNAVTRFSLTISKTPAQRDFIKSKSSHMLLYSGLLLELDQCEAVMLCETEKKLHIVAVKEAMRHSLDELRKSPSTLGFEVLKGHSHRGLGERIVQILLDGSLPVSERHHVFCKAVVEYASAVAVDCKAMNAARAHQVTSESATTIPSVIHLASEAAKAIFETIDVKCVEVVTLLKMELFNRQNVSTTILKKIVLAYKEAMFKEIGESVYDLYNLQHQDMGRKLGKQIKFLSKSDFDISEDWLLRVLSPHTSAASSCRSSYVSSPAFNFDTDSSSSSDGISAQATASSDHLAHVDTMGTRKALLALQQSVSGTMKTLKRVKDKRSSGKTPDGKLSLGGKIKGLFRHSTKTQWYAPSLNSEEQAEEVVEEMPQELPEEKSESNDSEQDSCNSRPVSLEESKSSGSCTDSDHNEKDTLEASAHSQHRKCNTLGHSAPLHRGGDRRNRGKRPEPVGHIPEHMNVDRQHRSAFVSSSPKVRSSLISSLKRNKRNTAPPDFHVHIDEEVWDLLARDKCGTIVSDTLKPSSLGKGLPLRRRSGKSTPLSASQITLEDSSLDEFRFAFAEPMQLLKDLKGVISPIGKAYILTKCIQSIDKTITKMRASALEKGTTPMSSDDLITIIVLILFCSEGHVVQSLHVDIKYVAALLDRFLENGVHGYSTVQFVVALQHIQDLVLSKVIDDK